MIQQDTTGHNARVRTIVSALLAQQTPVTFAPRGPSMNPLIRDGDSVVVHPATVDGIRAGQVVLYRRHNRLILHRLIRYNRRSGHCLLAADAALRGTDRIDGKTILGVATTVTRTEGPAKRIDCTRARLAGLSRYYMRPVRRIIIASWRRMRISWSSSRVAR